MVLCIKCTRVLVLQAETPDPEDSLQEHQEGPWLHTGEKSNLSGEEFIEDIERESADTERSVRETQKGKRSESFCLCLGLGF